MRRNGTKMKEDKLEKLWQGNRREKGEEEQKTGG